MKLHEKIRFMRQLQGWSQEEMADKLAMSVSGYAHIERGETDIQISRLEQIAKIFETDLLELLNFGEKNVVYFAEANNSQNNQHISQISHSKESAEIAHELEKYKLLNEQKDKEIAYLKEIIELMKKNNPTH